MIRPAAPGFNPETAASNRFQADSPAATEQILREFDGLVELLRAAGISVWLVEDSSNPPKPDAHFPNNWVAFFPVGRAAIFPMLSEARRAERRSDLLDARTVTDLSRYELEGEFLEGTGSVVLDHEHRIAYACESPRTCARPLEMFCQAFNYFPLTFTARDRSGELIYHTNVVMSLGVKFAVLCKEAVEHSNRVIAELRLTGKEVIEITMDQLHSFAGNCLALSGADGPIIVMSSQAYGSLRTDQIEALSRHGKIIHSPLDTIEAVGGGSARCMLAEVF